MSNASSSVLSRTVWGEYTLVVALNLVMTALKTWYFGRAYDRTDGYTSQERRLLKTQEYVRQGVGTLLWLGSLVVSYGVTKRLFPNQSELSRALTANLISSIPDATLRPSLTAKLSRLFLPTASKPALPRETTIPPVARAHKKPVETPTPFSRHGGYGYGASPVYRPWPTSSLRL